MPEVDFIRYMAAWHATQVESAAGRGVTLALSSTDDDRPKHAAWVTASRGEQEAQLIVWDSGEAEFAAGTPGGPATNEHHELRAIDELEALLDRLVASVDHPL